MTEKLRAGASGRFREALQQSMARILVGGDGCLAIEEKSEGLSEAFACARSYAESSRCCSTMATGEKRRMFASMLRS